MTVPSDSQAPADRDTQQDRAAQRDRDTLRNRHVLITGASRGIGAAIAQELGRGGAKLSLLARHLVAHPPAWLDTELRARCELLEADVTSPDSIHRALGQAIRQHGPVHILVNNAGQAESRAIDAVDMAHWNHMLAVNLTGSLHCIRAALPSLREAASAEYPARIINVASTAGLQGYPQVSAYVAAKHGLVGLTRALALELARQHITVNAVCPGYTDTALAAQAVENLVLRAGRSTAEAQAMLTARNPQRRLVRPEEVAAAVGWLCHPDSAAVNGQSIVIDGGEVVG